MEKQNNILFQSIMREINKLSCEMGFINKQSVKAIIKQEFDKADNKED